jgi:hypothetical protein
MPIQVHGVLLHAISGTELSRVRTEFDPVCIFPTLPPHPVQPHSESSGHGHLGHVPLPAQRQMQVPSSAVRIATRCRLRCFHQQETQQRAALLGDIRRRRRSMVGRGGATRGRAYKWSTRGGT